MIVDESGQEVILRGYGLGGWLVPEGYQLKIPGFGSPSVIREKLVDLIGEQNTQEFEALYRANYVAEVDITQIKAWGFNSIRLPFNYRMLSPEDEPDTFLEEGFALIDTVLAWCIKHELYLVLDMHCAPGGQSKDNIADADGIEARLWTEPENQDRIVALWTRLAERYSGEKWIGGYDLINEPVLPDGYTGSDLRMLYKRILAAIRPLDPDHLIFIEGNWYATDFTNLTPPFDPQMVYSFHKYWNENTQASIQYLINLRRNTNTPLWLGESGENSNAWFSECVRLMEKHGIGWNWWTHKKVATITSPYSATIPEGYQKILDYWNQTGPRPSISEAKSGLMAMAENLGLSNCEYRPGVVPSLLDVEFNIQPKPIKDHRIPGRLTAADYDLGTQGVAYSDNDYQNTHGLGSGDIWNRSGLYRNDGVDIERCNDEGTPYCVGFIENGEWLHYTAVVERTGIYRVSLRVAAPGNHGRCQLEWDGTVLSSGISIPATGGWSAWNSVEAGDYPFSRGMHTLKIYFINEGFNLSAVDFELIRSDDGSDSEKNTSGLRIGQNYPNPFMDASIIPLYLQTPSAYQLKIYNTTGREVKDLSGHMSEGGWFEIPWNGTDTQSNKLSSGIYFYRFCSGDLCRTRSMILLH